jgi:hypothetical protein
MTLGKRGGGEGVRMNRRKQREARKQMFRL